MRLYFEPFNYSEYGPLGLCVYIYPLLFSTNKGLFYSIFKNYPLVGMFGLGSDRGEIIISQYQNGHQWQF